MDTRVHRMEFKEDVRPEELKYVKEQGNLNGFQRRLAVDTQINDKYCQLSDCVNFIC